MAEEMHIAFCTDRNYAAYTGVAMTSIILHHRRKRLVFHLFHNGLETLDEEKFAALRQGYPNVEIYFYDLSDTRKIDSYKINHYYTKAVYFRWYMAGILDPALPRVLYLDGDILCLGDLQELYDLDISAGGGYALAAVGKYQTEKEIRRLKMTQPKVLNAGVLLIDLPEWRRQRISEQLFAYAEQNHEDLVWLDNDVMNSVLDGKFLLADEKWNHRIYLKKMPHVEILPEDRILHYSGEYKPWNTNEWNENEAAWWDCARKSPWNDLKKQGDETDG